MNTDPIADCFTRIRNAAKAGYETTNIPYSKLKEQIVHILKREGFLSSVATNEKGGHKNIVVGIRYLSEREPALEKIQRVSTPGRRVYTGAPKELRVRSGMGIEIISTSKGVMTDREAKEQNVGGEILGQAW